MRNGRTWGIVVVVSLLALGGLSSELMNSFGYRYLVGVLPCDRTVSFIMRLGFRNGCNIWFLAISVLCSFGIGTVFGMISRPIAAIGAISRAQLITIMLVAFLGYHYILDNMYMFWKQEGRIGLAVDMTTKMIWLSIILEAISAAAAFILVDLATNAGIKNREAGSARKKSAEIG